jgi:hypothetical protein
MALTVLGLGCDLGATLNQETLDATGDSGNGTDQEMPAVDAELSELASDSGIGNPTPADMGTPDFGEGDTGTMMPNVPPGETRYGADRLLSPLTLAVVDRLTAIRAKDNTMVDEVFMKVGASGTVNTRLLSCFSPQSSYGYDLDGRPELEETIDFFNMGDAGGSSPFDRRTEAAQSGKTAKWVQTGSPSPLDKEITALAPRFAFVNYGTNDMEMSTSYGAALFYFYDEFDTLITTLIDQGIIPIITGLNPRSDRAAAVPWVSTYNELTRAVAQRELIPFIDMYHAAVDLPDQGLISDGLHGNSHPSGPCLMNQDGLAYNYNIRNLLSLQSLDRLRTTLLESAGAPDTAGVGFTGDGSPTEPFDIDRLPFSHDDNTANSPHQIIDRYPSCHDNDQNESGPEIYYRLTLTERTPIRIMVFDHGSADVDLHLLDASGAAASCTMRNDQMIETTLEAGTYTIVADTFVSASSGPKPGAFLLLAVRCEDGDPSCN